MPMQIVQWPLGVPSCIQPLSPQGGLRDNRYSFETDSKMPPIERPATSWTPEVYSVELTPLSLDQFSLFQAWYRDDLRFGVHAFRMDHPVTKSPGLWKIVKGDPPYQVRKVGLIPAGSDRRRVGLSFTIMSVPGGAPDWWPFYQLPEGPMPMLVADFVKGRYGQGVDFPILSGAPGTVMNFTRASTATYVGRDGLIRIAGVNEPRIMHDPLTGERRGLLVEEARTNIHPRSQDFSDGWALLRPDESALSPAAVRAPDGTMTAAAFLCTTTNVDIRRLRASSNLATGPNDLYCGSIWVKSLGWEWVAVVLAQSVNFGQFGASARVNLVTGEANTQHGSEITVESWPDGWWRISAAGMTGQDSGYRMSVALLGGNTSVTSGTAGIIGAGVAVWGAQVELQPNLLDFPNEFDNSYWTKDAVTVDPDATTAPDGTMTADRVVASATAGPHHIRRNLDFPTGTVVTLSGVFKWNGTHVDVLVSNSNSLGNVGFGAVFDLQNGTIISQYNMLTGVILGADITSLGNDWYRCSITGYQSVSGLYRSHFAAHNGTTRNFTGDGVSGFYAWGAHLRDHRVPLLTSYIPTEAAAVTRAADVPRLSPILGLADLRVNDEVSVEDRLSQNLNGNYWPDGLEGIVKSIAAYPAGSL